MDMWAEKDREEARHRCPLGCMARRLGPCSLWASPPQIWWMVLCAEMLLGVDAASEDYGQGREGAVSPGQARACPMEDARLS